MDDMSQHIAYARQLSSDGSYSKAFDYYISIFKKDPSSKMLFEKEFRMVLTRLNGNLASAGKIDEIFSNFEKSLNTFPDNMFLLNDIGKYLCKYGFYSESMCHFQKALRVDSGFVDAEKNLNSVKNLMVERWHFRMLNDRIRNEAYRDAIHETLSPFRDSVLDVGTGTGLLSIYASECSPIALTGCDGSEAMTELAACILNENNVDLFVVINKMSTSLDYRMLGGKRSLLVTELFDAGLFGENILQALAHAWKELILNNGRVLPSKAEFFVMGAKCDQLKAKYQLCEQAKVILNIPNSNVHILTFGESYDCEDIHLYKSLKYVTDPQSLLKIDFNNHHEILKMLNREEPYQIELITKESGEINIVIGWFNLHLTEDIMLTTDPRAENRANAWQQAIFFDNPPIAVTDNQTIKMQFLINEGKLTMLPTTNAYIARISPETLRFLNDMEYVNKISSSIGVISLYLGQITEMSDINVADLSFFPLFGLLMLKRGANSLFCCAKTEEDSRFFESVFSANNIPLSKVTILVGECWDKNVFVDQKFHAIFCNVWELCGDVNLRLRDICMSMKHTNLHLGGLFMPANVTLMGQLISSPWIDINNRVYDENVNDLKIAMFINKYQVSQIFCVDPSILEFTPLSDPVPVAIYNSGLTSGEVFVPIIEDGEANAILCWYNIEFVKDLGEISTNRSDSFLECMAFLAYPKVNVRRERLASILRCVDSEGSIKLIIDDGT